MASRRALLSVADKSGIEALGRALVSSGFDLVSTGGTGGALAKVGLPVVPVEDLSGYGAMLDGRVKTLAPPVLAPILARREKAHLAELERHAWVPIDLVAVNLYPFESIEARGGSLSELVENIDVGGVTLLRAAAKNHEHVTVLCDPADYEAVAAALPGGGPSAAERRRLAVKALRHTAHYDGFIAETLAARFGLSTPPDAWALPLRRLSELRYGENHHQKAAFYALPRALTDGAAPTGGGRHEALLSEARLLSGKPLSYNNLLDADTAMETVKEFPDPTLAIIKHATPSGIACAPTLLAAWEGAYATDTYSPFGGIVAVNRALDAATAAAMADIFLEVVAAPSFEPRAREVLARKKSLRLVEAPGLERAGLAATSTFRSVSGGLLVQDRDVRPFTPAEWRTVTKRKPSKEEFGSLLFASRCVKHVRSNAVVFAKGTRTVGIGGGQTARVDASWIAVKKGGANIRGSVMASDAFFPFRDAVDVAADAGVVAIASPGGSIRDAEVIAAADERGLAMVFTGHRLFRH